MVIDHENDVFEDPENANVALNVDRDFMVISAKAITVDQLLKTCKFCGILRE